MYTFDSLFHCRHALGFVSLLLGEIVKMLYISGTKLNLKSICGENLDINAQSVLNIDRDYKRVDVCDTMRLFRFSHPQFWNGYKRGSDAHCKWPPFLEFEKRAQGLALAIPPKNLCITNGNVPISDKPQNLALIFEIGHKHAEILKQADFS